jgi:hypothetical protein
MPPWSLKKKYDPRLRPAERAWRIVGYGREKANADIELEFKQEVQQDGRATMWLILKSHIKQTLYLDGVMTVPGHKGAAKTSIVPLRAGLGDHETWPHPIVQLVFTNLRLKETSAADGSRETPPSERQR